MLKKIGIVVAGMLALMAWGQNGSVGKTAEVQGLVTVSEANVVRTARNGALVMDGSRVVTSSNGTVRIRLDNNCEISLRPNQSLVIDYSQECKALIASVQSLEGPSLAFLPARDVANGVLYLLGAAWILGGSGSGTTPVTPPPACTPGTPGCGEGGVIPIFTPE